MSCKQNWMTSITKRSPGHLVRRPDAAQQERVLSGQGLGKRLDWRTIFLISAFLGLAKSGAAVWIDLPPPKKKRICCLEHGRPHSLSAEERPCLREHSLSFSKKKSSKWKKVPGEEAVQTSIIICVAEVSRGRRRNRPTRLRGRWTENAWSARSTCVKTTQRAKYSVAGALTARTNKTRYFSWK